MPQRDQDAGEAGVLGMLDQQVAALAGLHGGRGGEHALEVAELADQLGRGLRPDAGDARHVVDAVADQRLGVDQLLGPDAELLHHLGRADRLLLDRVQHVDAGADQLHQVLVGGHDGGAPAGGDGRVGIGRDQVVGLPVRQFDRGDTEGGGRVADQDELRHQLGRGLGSVRLVLVVEAVAEGGAAGVEDDGEMGADMILQQLGQHVGEAEHGIYRGAVRAGHRRQGMKGAEDEARAVDQDEMRRDRSAGRQGGFSRSGIRHAGLGRPVRHLGSGPAGIGHVSDRGRRRRPG